MDVENDILYNFMDATSQLMRDDGLMTALVLPGWLYFGFLLQLNFQFVQKEIKKKNIMVSQHGGPTRKAIIVLPSFD
jgi:hypothetical protein